MAGIPAAPKRAAVSAAGPGKRRGLDPLDTITMPSFENVHGGALQTIESGSLGQIDHGFGRFSVAALDDSRHSENPIRLAPQASGEFSVADNVRGNVAAEGLEKSHGRSGSVDFDVVFDARDRIEFTRIQLRIGHLHFEFLLEGGDHVGQSERIQHARFEQRCFGVGRNGFLRDLLDDGEDAFLSSHAD